MFNEAHRVLLFAHPSLNLRYGYKVALRCFYCRYYCNKLIVKEICFSFRKGAEVGNL